MSVLNLVKEMFFKPDDVLEFGNQMEMPEELKQSLKRVGQMEEQQVTFEHKMIKFKESVKDNNKTNTDTERMQNKETVKNVRESEDIVK